MTGIGAILSYPVPGIMDIENKSDEEEEEKKSEGEEEVEDLENLGEELNIEEDY